ncbi:MAG: CubicO group peptidase (beta-lactamase class C family) [Halioglobus sp.]|jgi:CubicO group peptidase (beta-lactamase class C family)
MATIARQNDPHEFVVASSRALAKQVVLHKEEASSFADYVAQDKLLDGVVVLHGGKIVFEAYPNMRPWERHFAWSVTKVVTATARAVLHERQMVDMRALVARYVPALAGSAWASIAVQDIANMASGIECLDIDGYHDKATCIYEMEESLGIAGATGREPDSIEHLRAMQIQVKPATEIEYVSANANALMLLVEAVTGKPFALALRSWYGVRLNLRPTRWWQSAKRDSSYAGNV